MEKKGTIQACFWAFYLTVLPFLTGPVSGELQRDESGIWAFQKQTSLQYNAEEAYVEMTNTNFGPFGASKVSLGIKCLSCLEPIKNKIYFQFGYDENSSPYTPELIDIKLATPNSNEEHKINYVLWPRDGLHDVFIYFPLEFKASDLASVQFFPASPSPEQWYYLLVHKSSKALTASDGGKQSTAHLLHGGRSQRFKFNKDSHGGYKIVTSFENKVLTVKDGSSAALTPVTAEKFADKPYQIWFIQEYRNAFRLHPKHNFGLCLDLSFGRTHDGADVTSTPCGEYDGTMTWNIVKTC